MSGPPSRWSRVRSVRDAQNTAVGHVTEPGAKSTGPPYRWVAMCRDTYRVTSCSTGTVTETRVDRWRSLSLRDRPSLTSYDSLQRVDTDFNGRHVASLCRYYGFSSATAVGQFRRISRNQGSVAAVTASTSRNSTRRTRRSTTSPDSEQLSVSRRHARPVAHGCRARSSLADCSAEGPSTASPGNVGRRWRLGAVAGVTQNRCVCVRCAPRLLHPG